MKRTYQKPQIAFESFVLTQNIATNCGDYSNSTTGKPSHGEQGSCGWQVDGFGVIWVDQQSGCSVFYGPDDEVCGVCYNSPSGNGIFASL